MSSSWDSGYVAGVQVANPGTRAVTWSVTVTHRGYDRVRLNGAWNATGRQQGDSFVFTGGTLAPGATASFGYQMGKRKGHDARPSGCSVVGGRCTVS